MLSSNHKMGQVRNESPTNLHKCPHSLQISPVNWLVSECTSVSPALPGSAFLCLSKQSFLLFNKCL